MTAAKEERVDGRESREWPPGDRQVPLKRVPVNRESWSWRVRAKASVTENTEHAICLHQSCIHNQGIEPFREWGTWWFWSLLEPEGAY